MNDPAPTSRSAFSALIFLFVGRRPLRTLIRILLLIAIGVPLFKFALIPVVVSGDSMMPTYQDGQFGFANGLIYRFRDPLPGDIVVIEMAGRQTMYLKRILAGPGDRVFFQDGTLMVNDQPVMEPYVIMSNRWRTTEETLGPTEFFVAGDNRAMPEEWHIMGVVDRAYIAGRVLF